MLYQLSHVRAPVRVHLGPDRRISPASRSELYPILAQPPTRSGDDGKKSASPTYAGHSVTTAFTVQGRSTGNQAAVLDDSPRYRRPAGSAGRPGAAPLARGGPVESAGRDDRPPWDPGDAKAPGLAGRTGRCGSGRPAWPGAYGVSRPVTGARAGKLAGEGGEGPGALAAPVTAPDGAGRRSPPRR
jgi:hypothetical protein